MVEYLYYQIIIKILTFIGINIFTHQYRLELYNASQHPSEAHSSKSMILSLGCPCSTLYIPCRTAAPAALEHSIYPPVYSLSLSILQESHVSSSEDHAVLSGKPAMSYPAVNLDSHL